MRFAKFTREAVFLSGLVVRSQFQWWRFFRHIHGGLSQIWGFCTLMLELAVDMTALFNGDIFIRHIAADTRARADYQIASFD